MIGTICFLSGSTPEQTSIVPEQNMTYIVIPQHPQMPTVTMQPSLRKCCPTAPLIVTK
jgi:hypothetical protein